MENNMMQNETNNRKPRLVRLLCLLLALVVLAAVPLALTPILVPKYISTSPEGSLTAEYYASVAETDHDVLFVGDCEVYESFIPAILWEEYGISAYVRGSAQQLVWQSYYLLEDALRYETPQIVVFNVLALKYGEPQNEAYNRMTLDGMAWSQTKVDAIRASMTEEEEFLTYVFPFFRFHSRWDELTAEDLTYAYTDKPAVSDGGYLMQTAVVPHDPASDMEPGLLVDYTLPATAMAYLDRMVALCAEKGIELILIKAPTDSWHYHWYDEWDEQIVSYAAENGLVYYNFMGEADTIGLDMTTDTYDGGVHLNVYGAEKLTRYFGQILSETHNAPDRRENTDLSAVWNGRVASYYARKNQMLQANSQKS